MFCNAGDATKPLRALHESTLQACRHGDVLGVALFAVNQGQPGPAKSNVKGYKAAQTSHRSLGAKAPKNAPGRMCGRHAHTVLRYGDWGPLSPTTHTQKQVGQRPTAQHTSPGRHIRLPASWRPLPYGAPKRPALLAGRHTYLRNTLCKVLELEPLLPFRRALPRHRVLMIIGIHRRGLRCPETLVLYPDHLKELGHHVPCPLHDWPSRHVKFPIQESEAAPADIQARGLFWGKLTD